jgi:predicted nucleic acid-binding protein
MVLDATVAVRACLGESGFEALGRRELSAPSLLWIESASAIHELHWRNEISARLAQLAFDRLRGAPVRERRPRRLLERAWEVAEALGWAKLYDAHYVALAHLLDTPLLTLDGRLQHGAARVIDVVGPAEL